MTKKILILFLFVSLISCKATITKFMLKKVGVFDENVDVKKMTNGIKTVYFVPMHHIGKKTFYDNVKLTITSLKKNNNSIVFLESIAINDTLSIDQINDVRLKFRKFTGISLDKSGHLDTINNTLGKGKIEVDKKWGLINQPKNNKLGIDMKTDKIVDVPLNNLVEQIEKDFGKVILDSCDLNTPILAEYKCIKSIEKEKRNTIILDFRNQHIINTIENEKSNTIILIYGARHFIGIEKALKNNGFKKLKYEKN